MKEEALDRTMWRARFGRGFPVVRQTTKRMDERVQLVGFSTEQNNIHVVDTHTRLAVNEYVNICHGKGDT